MWGKAKKSYGPAYVRYLRGKSNDPAGLDWMSDSVFSQGCVSVCGSRLLLNEEIVSRVIDYNDYLKLISSGRMNRRRVGTRVHRIQTCL